MTTANRMKLNKSWLDDVPGDKVFWCHDGRAINNMEELAAALKDMSDDTFHYHVKKENNDFSNWLKDVVGDVTLAKDLRKTAVKTTASRKVETRLQSIQTKSQR